jgi:hypothetical protein
MGMAGGMMLGAGAGMLGGAMLANGLNDSHEDAYQDGYGTLQSPAPISLEIRN